MTYMKEFKIHEWIFIAAILGGLSVSLGAFGSHLLEGSLTTKDYDIFRTGVRYQMWHTLAILIVAVLQKNFNIDRFNQIQWAFLIGIILFSGSLYILVLSQLRWFGAITPIGGVAFVLGWGLLALSARKLKLD